MIADLDTLLTALYVELTDRIIPSLGRCRSGPGRPAQVTDAELVCLAVAQVLLRYDDERHWLRAAPGRVGHLFPRLLCQSEYNHRLKAASALMEAALRWLAELPLGLDATERLCSQMLLLLSLIAGQEIGVGPVVGVDAAGQVVWADWYAPRFRPEQSAWRWCPRHLVNQALPALATGLSALAEDLALQQVVDRAGQHLLAANGPEVLDVRIPVACSGLELLGP